AGRIGLAGILRERDPVEARALLVSGVSEVDKLLASLRRVTTSVPDVDVIADGIAAALRVSTSATPLELIIDDRLTHRYDPNAEETLSCCAMESIQNAVKHSAASRISVRLTDDDGLLTVVVCDDGRGFDRGQVSTGTGLHNIAERLQPWSG